MSLRNFNSHLEEAQAVIEGLSQSGINAFVTHEPRYSRTWLVIHVGDPQEWSNLKHSNNNKYNCPNDCWLCTAHREIKNDALRICRDITGRTGDCDGYIVVFTMNYWRNDREHVIKQEKWLAQFKTRMGIS